MFTCQIVMKLLINKSQTSFFLSYNCMFVFCLFVFIIVYWENKEKSVYVSIIRINVTKNVCCLFYFQHEHMTQYNERSDIRFWVSVTQLAALAGSTLSLRLPNDNIVNKCYKKCVLSTLLSRCIFICHQLIWKTKRKC